MRIAHRVPDVGGTQPLHLKKPTQIGESGLRTYTKSVFFQYIFMVSRMRKRNPSYQVPLGTLITEARTALGMSRVDLARATGINEGSLSRYERAGLEDHGQYPPSPKLAEICFVLGIPPAIALLSCLDEKDYLDAKNAYEEHKDDSPSFLYLVDENMDLQRHLYLMGVLVEKITQAYSDQQIDLDDEVKIAMDNAKGAFKKRDELHRRLEKMSEFEFVDFDTTIPGLEEPRSVVNEKNKYGLGREAPGRSTVSDQSKTVGAVSRPKKRKGGG